MISIDWNQAHKEELARKLKGKKPEDITTLRLDNAVFSPEGLAPFTNLVSLSIYPDNEAGRQSSLNVLPHLPSLVTLDAPEHVIADIPEDAGERWPKLEELNLSNNKVSSPEALDPLKNCTNLRSLSVVENPISKDSKESVPGAYRTAIFERIPQLTRVDGYNKEGEEEDELDDEEEEEEETEEQEEDAAEADDELGVNGVRADRPEDTLSGPPPAAAAKDGEVPDAKRPRTEGVDKAEEVPDAKIRRMEPAQSAPPVEVQAP